MYMYIISPNHLQLVLLTETSEMLVVIMKISCTDLDWLKSIYTIYNSGSSSYDSVSW